MDRHRTRFLAGLSARLERDRVLRESEADTPSPWHRHAERPDRAEEPAAGEAPESALSADPPEPGEPADIPHCNEPADLLEPNEPATPAEVIAIRRTPARGSHVEAFRGPEPDRAPAPALPWSETGMSQALRDAIASVRRVSHGMPERRLARADQVRSAVRPFDEDPADGHAPLEAAEKHARSSSEDQELREEVRFDQPTAAERFDDQDRYVERFDDQKLREEVRFDQPTAAERFDDQDLYEDSSLAGTYTHPPEAVEQAAAVDEWPARSTEWRHEPASLAEDAPPEELRFDGDPDAPLPFGGRARRGRRSSEVPAGWTAPPDADAADEEPWFDDPWDQDLLPGLQEAGRDGAPRWRGVTQRRGLHLAALVLAPLFVLVAGLGLGILSGAQGFDRVLSTLGWASLADGSVGATRTQPAPPAASADRAPISGAEPPPASMPSSAGTAAPPAAPAPSPQLSELKTVRVSPLPAPPKVEQPPADRRASDMPLPPPPKPAPWSSRSGEASGPSDPIARAADTAAVALPAADGTANDAEVAAVAALESDGAVNDGVEDAALTALETDGAGSPFEPILIKTSAAEPRVFVHYAESAPGGPTTALNLVGRLRAAGFKVEERPVEASIAKSSIRYFFPGDRDEAEALSAQLQSQVPGGAVTIVDLTSYQPKPRQGHLEVWLAG